MKKILTLLFSLATTVLVAQQLPNYGFESWSSASILTGGTYQNLNNWTTISSVTGGLALTVTQTKDNYAGTYAVDMKSATVFGNAAPGLICQCEINAGSQRITGGVPYTAMPTGIQAYIKYAPVGGDSMYIAAVLTKWDAVNKVRDTIATSIFFFNTLDSSAYFKVSPTFYYYPKYSGTAPDTMVFASSSSVTPSTKHTGTDLKMDNVELLGVTATDNIFSSSYISVYPNPAQSVLNIRTANTDAQYADLYDVIGNRLQHVRITSNNTTIQLNSVADGVYLYRITNAAGQPIKTGKVTVAK